MLSDGASKGGKLGMLGASVADAVSRLTRALDDEPSSARGSHSETTSPAGPASGDARTRVLIVDDHKAICRALSKFLDVSGFATAEADCVVAARERLAESRFDVVLLDLDMPGENGLTLLPELAPLLPHTLVIVTTGNDDAPTAVKAMKQGAVDYICKPYSCDGILAAIRGALGFRRRQIRDMATQSDLEVLVRERTEALHSALERLDDTGAAIKRVVCALAEIRDAETGAHLRRMGVYARELARALPASVREAHRVDHAYVDRLHEAAPLHDIGKIGVPDQILLKRGPLTDDERCTMRQHSAIGRAILQTAGAQTESQSVPLLQVGMEICESHHERWDGAGYPHGIRGTEIPLSARIVAVADVYDALATSRPYRAEAFAHETVCEMIVEERGGAFDPDVVDAFIVCEASLGVISQGLFEEAFETVALPPITIETDSTSRGSAARVWETSAFVETARDLGLIS